MVSFVVISGVLGGCYLVNLGVSMSDEAIVVICFLVFFAFVIWRITND